MVIPLQYAVLAGVGLSVILHVVRQSNQVTIKRWRLDPAGDLIETDPPASLPGNEVVALQPYGSLFFAAASVFETCLPAPADASRNAVVILPPTRHTCSPGAPSGWRLVAITRIDGERSSSATTRSAQPSITCSQLSRTSSVDSGNERASAAGAGSLVSSRRNTVAATTCGTRSRLERRGQVDPPGAADEVWAHRFRERDGKPRLSGPTRSTQGQQTGAPDQRPQFAQCGLSPHEPGEPDRQVPERPIAPLTRLGGCVLTQYAHLAILALLSRPTPPGAGPVPKV